MVPPAATVQPAQRVLPVPAVTAEAARTAAVPAVRTTAPAPKPRAQPQTVDVSANPLTDVGDNYFCILTESNSKADCEYPLDQVGPYGSGLFSIERYLDFALKKQP
jgi:hypothetical protein